MAKPNTLLPQSSAPGAISAAPESAVVDGREGGDDGKRAVLCLRVLERFNDMQTLAEGVIKCAPACLICTCVSEQQAKDFHESLLHLRPTVACAWWYYTKKV